MKKKKKPRKKNKDISPRALSNPQAQERLKALHPDLLKIFSNYIVIGLRRLPEEESQKVGMEEKSMYFAHGDMRLACGLAQLAAEDLAEKAALSQIKTKE